MAGTLLVLLWKHFTVRKRRFIITPVELISPLLFILLLFIFKNKINPTPKFHGSDEELTIYHTEPLSLQRTVVPQQIIYTPDTNWTHSLMDKVGEKLKLNRITGLPDIGARGYYALDSDTRATSPADIQGIDRKAFVIFQDVANGMWPRKLNYTIRLKKNYMTHEYESLDGDIGPHERFGAEYEEFMRLQWAIDTSYIQLLTGNNITQTVTLQEFPYLRAGGSSNIKLLCDGLMLVCVYSLITAYVLLVSRLLEERATGIQELIKMVGVSTNVLGISHFLNVLPTGLVYSVVGAILLTVTDTPLIPHGNGFLIFLMLFLHFVSVVAMAFACSYIAKSAQNSVTVSLLSFMALWLPIRLLGQRTAKRGLVLLTGLLPHAPMQWFWLETGQLETFGKGVTFSTMFTNHSSMAGSVLLCYVFMLIQIAVFFALAWYLSHVRPGNYGIAQPPNFLFKREYWSHKKVVPRLQEDEDQEEQPMAEDQRYFEKPPTNAEVGIKIVNVSKVFPKHRALTNVNLDVYKGEITVLLGHNGAGKTTLMSIISGMMSATEGKIYVNGKDTVAQQLEVRKQLGLCPQHNLFFPDLTVKEHAIFFSMLKGVPYKEAEQSARTLLEKLGLHEKADNQSSQLSGGMKRRLQLACALAGGAEVLILDEPTSGLDVETRRELWDMLLALRGNRTVLLTTHFMEEADVLGDRVAALHGGKLRSHATPMYLKKNIGTGYRLSFTTIGVPNETAITSVIKSIATDASLKEKSLNTISYNLPAQNGESFPRLFATLENKRSELGIDSIGVGVSTLEEVFLKLCSDVDTSFSVDIPDGAGEASTYQRVTGVLLYLRQVIALLKRQVRHTLSRKVAFLILQLILPIIMLVVFTKAVSSAPDNKPPNPSTALDLDIYKEMPATRAFYNVSTNGSNFRAVVDSFPKVKFERTHDVIGAVLRAGEDDILEYNKYVLGIELNDTDAKVLYTTTVRHAAPVALNLLSNVLASKYLPYADGRTITTYNHPIKGAYSFRSKIKEPKNMMMIVTWGFFAGFIVLSTIMNLVFLPCKERVSGARHAHVMAGGPAALHWLVTFLYHTVLCFVTLAVPAAIIVAAFETEGTLDQVSFLCALLLILLLGIMAFLAFMYFLSQHLGERAASITLSVIIIVFGFLTPIFKETAELFEENMNGIVRFLLTVVSYTIPPHTLMAAVMKAGNVARLNAYCSLNKDMCPALNVVDGGFDVYKCCTLNQDPRCYFCVDKYSPGKMVIFLLLQTVVYMTIVILTERGLFNMFRDKVMNKLYKPPETRYDDEMVRAERTYVDKAIALPSTQVTDAMLVNDVHKNYSSLLGKKFNAVKGVSFSIKKGECFGLLGVNGAGKSTIFKMLTAEEHATRGSIFANGHHLKWPHEKYLRSLGYCPQFFGLDDFQTGKQNLELLLTLRGLNAEDVDKEVKSWISVVGLEKYMNRAVVGYSGGCMRRLATAAALCNGAPITLLDEPTSGVDVSARRRVWAAMRRSQAQGRAAIITSHSMDEMEALCGRIAIMSAGELAALGTPPALRAAHAAGHAVILKIRAPAPAFSAGQDVVDSPKAEVEVLKNKLKDTFNCTLKDEHKTMLHYHINETMRYSDLFSGLEQLKAAYPHLIEDYSVTETTLEEVFLSFAKE